MKRKGAIVMCFYRCIRLTLTSLRGGGGYNVTRMTHSFTISFTRKLIEHTKAANVKNRFFEKYWMGSKVSY